MCMLTLLRETQLLQQHVEPIAGQPIAGQHGVRGHLSYPSSLRGIQPQEQTAGLIKIQDVPLQTFHHHRLRNTHQCMYEISNHKQTL